MSNFRFRLHSPDQSQVLWENIDGANSTQEATEFLRQNSYSSLPGSIERSTDDQQTWELLWSGNVAMEKPDGLARGEGTPN